MGKLLGIVVVVVSLAVIAGLALRPGAVIGVSDEALAESIARAQDAEKPGKCRGPDDARACTGEGGERLRVTIDGYGCWDATPDASGGVSGGKGRGKAAGSDAPEAGSAEKLSGCVNALDYVG